jgi:hypothetical protein
MPESRKRHGHHDFQKSSAIPGKQRTKGRITWAILFGVFGLLISFFAAGLNYVALGIGTAVAAVAGYLIGKKMEKDATR